ncbi:hypothetical protein PsYK624_025960 [Phanerochaete sordida]|uniref:F-box domain-containing protein n=1 Tax=Phanerochaete sordida TaxID=48140 RepID=A0A9P3L8U9_9APHY|nr:hypothetical protein PsYK624_025960 [Phanerochaete sordida]
MDPGARRKRMEDLRAARTIIQRRIEVVRNELNELDAALSENERELSDCAPVSTLPDDTLKLILEEAYQHRSGDCSKDARAVLNATHVSQRWRQAAISTPQLWTCVHVGSPRLVRLFIKRSGTLPLHVICIGPDAQDGSDEDEDEEPPWLSSYLKQLSLALKHAHRLKHIRIETACDDVFFAVLRRIQKTTLPLLENLELLHAERHADLGLFIGTNFVDIEIPSPNLQSLSFASIPLSFRSPFFGCLRKLTATTCDISVDGILALAGAAPRLTTLVLDTPRLENRNDNRAALFPSLESLTILGQPEYFEHEALLRCFDAPALAYLALAGLKLAPDVETTVPQRVFPAVRTLCLMNVSSDDDLPRGPRIFRCTPDAAHLELRSCTSNISSLLSSICRASPFTLPKLETLTVEYSEDIQGVLLDVAESRGRFEPPLKAVQLVAKGMIQTDTSVVDRLSQYVTVRIDE